jgi:hypothetical protein
MIDWITGIWTKPLATWTLLDIIGILILIPVVLFAAVAVFIVVARIHNSVAVPKARPESHEAMRKRLGYDK